MKKTALTLILILSSLYLWSKMICPYDTYYDGSDFDYTIDKGHNGNIQIIDGISYELYDSTAFVVSSNENKLLKGTVNILPYIVFNDKKYEIKKICTDAFLKCDSIKEIIIPHCIDTICTHAFYGCKNLKIIEIRDGVKWIATEAFIDCGINEITIPQSVECLPDNAFRDCRNISKLTLKDGIKEIGEGALALTKLKAVNIPQTLDCMSPMAFTDFKAEFISFHNQIKIKNHTKDSLFAITVDDNNERYCSVDGVLYNKDTTELIRVPGGRKELTIAPTVRKIRWNAFAFCTHLTMVKLPEGVSIIDEQAFLYCHNLYYIYIPQSVKEIKHLAFKGCHNLKKIKLYNPNILLDPDAFDNQIEIIFYNK